MVVECEWRRATDERYRERFVFWQELSGIMASNLREQRELLRHIRDALPLAIPHALIRLWVLRTVHNDYR